MLKYGQALPLSDWDIAIVGAKSRLRVLTFNKGEQTAQAGENA
jgi:predicted nucleotidyltransferase